MPALADTALVVASYLLGSIPFAFVLGRLRGVDIRQLGSRNVGATNLARTLGRRWGIAAFLLDFLKGLAPVLAGQALAGASTIPGSRPELLSIVCGGAAVLGHVFPLYLGFRGGKAVATTFGVMTALEPFPTLAAGVVWVVLYLPWRLVSLASLLAVLVLPAGIWFRHRSEPLAEYLATEVLALAAVVVIVVRHRSNIVRLVRREEHAFRRGEEATRNES